MKTVIKQIVMIVTAFAFTVAAIGCGSGSGGSSVKNSKAKASLKTAGLVPPGFLAGTLEVEISIPYGVTAELIPGTSNPAKNVVQLIGASDPKMTLNALDYLPATSSSKGSLRIIYLNAAGFTPADSLLVQLDVTTGFFPTAADFSLTKFEVTRMSADGNTIYAPEPVLNPTFTVEVI